jgi:hypothetical protein
MDTTQRAQAPLPTAHAQPIDPVAGALQAGADEAAADPNRLQEVLPEIKDLAEKVGGMKNLADIAETLEQADE